ncbi:MAG: lysine 2,3-aminomutase, partial [Parachlamydiaceae bacterium]|nr:lysine 2,3-aminomutase [Parachlamydiaceae bacterium]
LYQCDLITGSAHFRTNVSQGIQLIQEMRGYTTGYGIPQYVIDGPGGGGKIPLNPNYIKEINENELVLKNFRGDEFKYPLNPSQSVFVSEPNPKKENQLSVLRCP